MEKAAFIDFLGADTSRYNSASPLGERREGARGEDRLWESGTEGY